MTYKVELPPTRRDCPNWWNEFTTNHYNWEEELDKRGVNAIWKDHSTVEYLEFPSARDFTLFLLQL